MGRLRSLGDRVGTLAPKTRRLELDHDTARRSIEWRKWYGLARWKAKPHGLRWQCFVRDGFTCQWPGCGRVEPDTSKLVADHIVPHRGDHRLFFDLNNLQTLCKDCHDTHKQRAERAPGVGGV
jgi:5-methylcytosine-specific restriction endonuclease McrA